MTTLKGLVLTVTAIMVIYDEDLEDAKFAVVCYLKPNFTKLLCAI
jgi:hypothetical protein